MTWQARAACAGDDPEAWFPEGNDSGGWARLVCSTCPVRSECLAHAVTYHITYGVWGGLTANQRRARKKKETA